MEAKKKRLKLQCPFCETLFDVTDLAPGSKVHCAECEHTMVVPDKQSTRRIPEALFQKVREEQAKKDRKLDVLELHPEQEKQAGKEGEKSWIDWNAVRRKKGPGET